MPRNDNKVGVTFIWAIENFVESFKANLVSPIFLSNSLNDTEWQISMYPNGCNNDDDYISLVLERCGSDDKGIERIIIDCELSILDEDGSPLESMELKNQGFVRGRSWTCQKFVLQDNVFDTKKSEHLPLDILTVRCRMWRRFNENTQAELRCSRTKIERSCFIWTIPDFCRLKAHQKKKIHVKKTDSGTPILTFEFFLEVGNGTARIEITPAESPTFELSCIISILDHAGKVFKSEEGSHSFKLTMNDWCLWRQNLRPPVWQFPSFITKNVLVVNKKLYVPMDVLSLRVECFFWSGYTKDEMQHIPIQNFQVSEKLSSTQKSDKQCMTENLPHTQTYHKQCTTENLPNPQKCDKQSMTETEISQSYLPTTATPEKICDKESCTGNRDCHSHKRFVHDIQCMYEEGFLSDFSLRAGNKTFQVHKNILSARSQVFRAMFATDMKEKDGNGIDIPDMDEDTLQKMLLFVYSNKIEDLEWESAVNLYFAADKYAIEDLRNATCSILKSKLSVSNVCEILVHADLHEDQDLKSTAMEFIVSHDKEIVGTEDWKKFQKKHIHLTVEILSVLYTKMKN